MSVVLAKSNCNSLNIFISTNDIDWNNGNIQYIQLLNDIQIFTFSNPILNGKYTLILKQPAYGNVGTVTWPENVSWLDDTPFVLSLINNAIDIIAFVYDLTEDKYFTW